MVATSRGELLKDQSHAAFSLYFLDFNPHHTGKEHNFNGFNERLNLSSRFF